MVSSGPISIGVMVTFTDRAREVLARSTAAARRLNPAARVRIAPDGAGGIRAELTDAVQAGDEVLDVMSGTTVIIALGLTGLIDAGEHDELELTRPAATTD
jgi:Fe-S cluster assembly iron-binding protein IscA